MTVELKSKKYFLLQEVCRETGISRSTLLHWLNRGIIGEPLCNRRGWLIFSNKEMEYIRKETERTA